MFFDVPDFFVISCRYARPWQSRGRVFIGVCVNVCLSVLFHTISKTDASVIIQLDIEIFHDDLRKYNYFEVKRPTVKVMRYKKTLPAWVVSLSRVLDSSQLRVLAAISISVLQSCALQNWCCSSDRRQAIERHDSIRYDIVYLHIYVR